MTHELWLFIAWPHNNRVVGEYQITTYGLEAHRSTFCMSLYSRWNDSYGYLLHSIQGIDCTQNMGVYNVHITIGWRGKIRSRHMTLMLTYRFFVWHKLLYYRWNDSYGYMLHSIHGIDCARKMGVYACTHNNRVVWENGGNCYSGTGHDDG